VRALLALVAALGTPDVVAPPVVDWRDAGQRTGQVVTIEGDVHGAECSEDRCILEFAPEDPRGFRVVVLLPMFSRAADAPDAAYRGRRIRATGKVERFQGRVEMVLRGTSQIELADTATVPPSTTPPTTRPTAPPPTAPPATLPPAPPPTVPPATAPEAARPPATLPPAAPAPPPAPPEASQPAATPPAPLPTATTTPGRVEAPPPPPSAASPREDTRAKAASCEQAKARWRDVASDVRSHSADLERCLRALPYRCHPESAALAAVLPLFDEAERQVDAACR
jgi:hypothetical protein